MSDKDKNPSENEPVSEEMLKHLDILMNMDLFENEEVWEGFTGSSKEEAEELKSVDFSNDSLMKEEAKAPEGDKI